MTEELSIKLHLIENRDFVVDAKGRSSRGQLAIEVLWGDQV
jgi:hypothetical protein